MLLPTTLTIPKVKAPCSFAFLIADNVSAVSPDWLIEITNESEFRCLFLYLNSDAYSTLIGFDKTDPSFQFVEKIILANGLMTYQLGIDGFSLIFVMPLFED